MSVEKHEWDKKQGRLGASFLQSSSWADFQKSIGHGAHFLAGENWSCLLLERKTRIGRYFFAPYGPTSSSPTAAKQALMAVKVFGSQHRVDWIRVEPRDSLVRTDQLIEVIKRSGGKSAPREIEPHLTRIVDLSPEPDKLLSSISQTTRNAIRRSEREKFISYKTSTDPADISLFIGMLKSVAGRKGVGFYPDSYYEKQARSLMPAGIMYLELAYEDKTPIGSAIIHDYNQLSCYTYAATAPEGRSRNISALLLWQVFLNAKKRGMKKIDLYGIAPEGVPPTHPWSGFSSFKKKFGGEVVEYAGTWDIPLTTKYRLYTTAYSARKALKSR